MIRNLKTSSLKEKAEYRSAIREQTKEERDLLREDMKKNGQLDPIRLDSGKIILDGYSRWEVALELKWDTVKTVEIEKPFISDETAIKWIQDHNLARRHLSREERDKAIIEAHAEVKESAGETRGRKKIKSDDLISADQATIEKEKSPSVREMTAEAVKEKTGEDVSTATVGRVVRKDKEEKDPDSKKVKVPKTVKAWIMFRRMSVDSWEVLRWLMFTKKEAEQFVKDQRADGNPMFDVEIKCASIEINFFTDYDKKSFTGV